MPSAKPGDQVKVHYTGKLSDGAVFDSSAGREPLAFTLAEGEIIEGFDSAVEGMKAGETRIVTIPADQAYGPYHDDMVLVADRKEFPPDFAPELGQEFELEAAEGQVVRVMVTEVTDDTIILDANHPLAGEDLTFEITLVGDSDER